MKKRTMLLSLSLIFGVAYHALFIAAYLLHKPLLGWLFYPPETVEQLEPVYSAPVIAAAAVCGIVFAAFVILMQKRTGKGLFVGAAVFSAIAFIAERWVNYIPPVWLLHRLNAEHGVLGEYAYALSHESVTLLDCALLPLFVGAIALMCCAFCVKD